MVASANLPDSCLVGRPMAGRPRYGQSVDPIPISEGLTMDAATSRDYRAIAEFLMHAMSVETRRRLMRELPGAYNRIHGREIVTVFDRDGDPV
jgi:hypothetical protein